jgi:capsular polysaccharide biosynthesis protein
MKIDNVSILDEANEAIVPPPIKPNPKMNIVISFVVSLMLAIGFVFILEYLDDSVKTEEDIKKYFGLPTLGVISKIKTKELQANALSQTQRQAGETGYVSAKS